MAAFQVWVGFVNLAVYVGLAGVAIVSARRRRSPLFRNVLWLVAAVAGVFVIGALQLLLNHGEDLGLASDSTKTWALSYGQMILSIYALVVAAFASALVPGFFRQMAGHERVMRVMTDEPIRTSVSEIKLTPRELNVVQAILGGALTDREIADALFIAPATAATHVRNVMKKVGVTNRRALLFVDGAEDASP